MSDTFANNSSSDIVPGKEDPEILKKMGGAFDVDAFRKTAEEDTDKPQ